MLIEFLKISNILSFKYYQDPNAAPKIDLSDGVNILIGQNGSGKSTALEVINFVFKKVLFVPYNVNLDYYTRRSLIPAGERAQIIQPWRHTNNTIGFRLDANWNSEALIQTIIIKIVIDDIDRANLALLHQHRELLGGIAGLYSGTTTLNFNHVEEEFEIVITLNPVDKSFSTMCNHSQDSAYQYLVFYDYYRQLIDLFNEENPNQLIPNLQESFTLIGGFRNYHSFSPSISLSGEARQQLQDMKNNEFVRSTNSSEQGEPAIFNLVRLRVAGKHYDSVFTNKNEAEAAGLANNEDFLKKINNKLGIINLKVEIKLVKKSSWSYNFSFYDVENGRLLSDINSLSAGQKAIVHLIFEAYGRGGFKGGVVIIDEPEIHLHYQFQYEYLKIIEALNTEQKAQYILVTHSEALISSKTIAKVKRFALDSEGSTVIKSPVLQTEQQTLIKILDNTRSTFAFFAKKVVLVEGDSDRYFFREILLLKKPELFQEIAILDIGGKGNYPNWKIFFEAYGLAVYYITDFDSIFSMELPSPPNGPMPTREFFAGRLKQNKLNSISGAQLDSLTDRYNTLSSNPTFLTSPQEQGWRPLIDYYVNLSKVGAQDLVSEARSLLQDVDALIDAQYAHNVFILKQGALEAYANVPSKGLKYIIPFCTTSLPAWISSTNAKAIEIVNIINRICS